MDKLIGGSFVFHSRAVFRLNGTVDCPERERLVGAFTETLMRIIETALRQHMAVKSSASEACLFDQEFAAAVGEKERRLGALLEHEREHGCGAHPT